MGLDEVKASLPEYAKDIRLNLGGLANGSALTEQQLWGAVVAAALASPPGDASAGLVAEGQDRLSPTAFAGAQAAVAVMAMNNVYYRAKHMLAEGGATYDNVPARLRMQVIATREGAEKADFELWCLVVSAVNGCGSCLSAHERALRTAGMGPEQIHEGLRIAAIVHAACATSVAASLVRAG